MKITIMGCGRVGAYLAGLLDANGHQVTVLDIDAYSFRRLPPTFGGTALIGSGTDEETLKRAGNRIILFVGRITLQKGPDYFVRVAKRVLEFDPKVYFVMVGSGDMAPQVMQLAASLGISDRFFFPGFLRGVDLAQIYQAADLYILPSVSEPFGITPLESLTNGTPVMVSKQSGVAEVLSHALKVDFWDIDEMTNQILAVLRHQSLKQTLAEYGQTEVKKITWAEAARQCLDVYQRVCHLC